MRLARLLLACAAAIPAGCDRTDAAPADAPAFGRAPLEQVFRRIKQEIGAFHEDGIRTEARWPAYLEELGASADGCPRGRILRFEITDIRMTFQIASERTVQADGKAAFSIPYVVSVQGGGGGGRTVGQQQQLTYFYYPPPQPDRPSPAPEGAAGLDRGNAIILGSLNALRDAIVAAGRYAPCFRNPPEKTDNVNSLTFGLQITDKGSLGVELSFAPLTLSAAGSATATTGNTIQVNFRPVNIGAGAGGVR